MSRYLLERVGAPHHVIASCATIDGAVHEARSLSRRDGAVLVRDTDDRPAAVRGVAEQGRWRGASACPACGGVAGVVCPKCSGLGWRVDS